MVRIFIYDGKEYPDPDPKLTTDEVRQNLANFFPELSNAETKEIKRGDDKVFTFTKRTGTKGSVLKIDIREVPGSDKSLKYVEIKVDDNSPVGDAMLLDKASLWLIRHNEYSLLGLSIERTKIDENDNNRESTLMLFVE